MILVGGWLLRKGRNRASGINLDAITITDTDDQEQERLMRQQGYINRGKQMLPFAIIAGFSLGAGLAYVFGQATSILVLTILLG